MEDWERIIRSNIAVAFFDERLTVNLDKLRILTEDIIKQIKDFKEKI